MFGKRRKKEWERAYGSYERVWWVRQLNCCVCQRLPSQNAHVRTGGMGRKADARHIIPLCAKCHRALHDQGRDTFQAEHGIDLDAEAATWEERWQAHKRGDRWLGF